MSECWVKFGPDHDSGIENVLSFVSIHTHHHFMIDVLLSHGVVIFKKTAAVSTKALFQALNLGLCSQDLCLEDPV